MTPERVIDLIRIAVRDIGSTSCGVWCLYLQVQARQLDPGLMALAAALFAVPLLNIGALRSAASGSDTPVLPSPLPPSSQPPQSQSPSSQPTSST